MTSTILASIPSPAQGVWHIWIIPIRAYALCIIAGIIAALVIGDRRWVARGGERGVIYDIALWAVPFGLVGGRLYHVMTDWPTYFGETGLGFFAALRIWDGGLGIWGAVALGGVGAWIGCRMNGIPLPAFGDAVAPGIVLAQAIGRVGNYFNQELYGGPTTLPWGLEIFKRVDANGASDMLNGVSTGQLYEPTPVHPTFLYELLWNLLVFAVLIWADRRFKLGHGRLFALYVAGYCVGRFWVELMRTDHANTIAGIRINTFTSTFVFIGAVIYIMVATKGREDPATLRGKRDDEDEEEVKVLATVAAASAVVAAASGAGAEGEPEPVDDAKPPPDAEEAEVEDDDGGSTQAEESADESAPEAPESVVGQADEVEVEAEVESDAEPEVDEPAVAEAVLTDTAESADTEEPEAEAAEPEAGIGAVDGEELAAAEEAAPEVQDAVVEQAEEAEEVAAADADEPEAPETPEVADSTSSDADEEETAEPAESDESDDADTAEPEAGLGSVDGEELTAAEEAAPELHEVEQAEEAADAELEDDSEPDASAEPAPDEVADTADDAPAAQAVTEPRRRWWRRGS